MQAVKRRRVMSAQGYTPARSARHAVPGDTLAPRMPRRSVIPQEDLELVARRLAAGIGQKQLAAELGWDALRMRRCVDRLKSETWAAYVHHWPHLRGHALEWLRFRELSTREELAAIVEMNRQRARDARPETLADGARLRTLGHFDTVERIYRHHLQDDPDDQDVVIELGACLLDMGRLDEALELLERALSVMPEHSRGRLFYALVLERIGRFPEALAELERAYQLDPHDMFRRILLGHWLARKSETPAVPLEPVAAARITPTDPPASIVAPPVTPRNMPRKCRRRQDQARRSARHRQDQARRRSAR